MSRPSMPWRAHPPGVWTERATDDGSALLVEFGGEASIGVLARVVPDASERRALWRALRRTQGRTVRIGGVPWTVDDPTPGLRIARTASGALLVEVRLADRSGRATKEVDDLLHDALAGVDLEGIARRTAAAPVAITPERLRPWPLPPDHPLVATHAIARLPGGLSFGVAAVRSPHATPVGPSDALWEELGPDALLGRAVLNLVADAARGDLPLSERSLGAARVLAIGPHPLAPCALLLPDLELLTREVVGGDGPLTAIPLAPELLLVAPPDVGVPADAWMPAVRVGELGT